MLISSGLAAGAVAAAALAAAQPVPRPLSLARPPAQATTVADWRVAQLSAGSWSLRQSGGASVAEFGSPAARAQLALRCEATRGAVRMTLRAAGGGSPTGRAAVIIVRTSTQDRRVAATGAAAIVAAEVAAEVAAHDSLLDAIVFSRGRWAVGLERAGPGAPPAMLVLPVSAEAARIVEDCRN